MKRTTWIIIVAVIGIVVFLFAGLLPLPGQKDNVTPLSEPGSSAKSPSPPSGPPERPAGETGLPVQAPQK
jgi:hypothetical protein